MNLSWSATTTSQFRCIQDSLGPSISSTSITQATTATAARHAAAVHVGLRIESGFDLVQIIAEYHALRACVLRLWRTDDPESFAGLRPLRFPPLPHSDSFSDIVSRARHKFLHAADHQGLHSARLT